MLEPRVQVPWFATFLVVGVLFGVGIASPYWIYTKDVYKCGLWSECVATECKSLFNTKSTAHHIVVVQVLMSLAVCLLIIALGACLLWLYPIHSHASNATRLLTAAFTSLSGVLGFIGVVTYGISHLHNQPLKSLSRVFVPNGWAYWLSVHTSLVLLVMGCINACYAVSHRGGHPLPGGHADTYRHGELHNLAPKVANTGQDSHRDLLHRTDCALVEAGGAVT